MLRNKVESIEKHVLVKTKSTITLSSTRLFSLPTFSFTANKDPNTYRKILHAVAAQTADIPAAFRCFCATYTNNHFAKRPNVSQMLTHILNYGGLHYYAMVNKLVYNIKSHWSDDFTG